VQTAQSLENFDRRQVAYVNQRHINEDKLLNANVQVINEYNQFDLPKRLGSGKSALADGTKWDVYEQNLLSEYHIRYGGWGGIGYYHVSDTYIALFSSFISCGVWEAVYILDGLLENKSDIRPDTLHADTQGQSEPVFGLAHLLKIKLMPRIRNWKDLTFYLSDDNLKISHLQQLFSDTIDFKLLYNHFHDMLRVAISISKGKIRSSAILRKLGTYSRKNKLYLAFRELGRVERTEFLLNYIAIMELRRVIDTATTTSESWNNFIQWVSFGGHEIRQNNREEQRKFIRYNHLVANLVHIGVSY
jgi:TnpA family transposase